MFNFKKKRRLNNSVVKIKGKGRSSGKINLSFYLKILSFFSALFLVLIFFFSAVFKISGVDFERGDLSIDPTEVLSELEVYSGKNIFFTSVSGIEKNLEKKFPRFKEIKINRSLPDRLVLKVLPYEDIFVLKTFFTKENKETGFKEKYLQNFLVSQSGELKDLIDDSKLESLNLITINSREDTLRQIEGGEVFFDNDSFYKTQLIIDKLEGFYSLKVSEVYFYNNAQELHFVTDIGDLWINLSRDLSSQLEKISFIRSQFGEKTFNYIDLRVSGKIIYKD